MVGAVGRLFEMVVGLGEGKAILNAVIWVTMTKTESPLSKSLCRSGGWCRSIELTVDVIVVPRHFDRRHGENSRYAMVSGVGLAERHKTTVGTALAIVTLVSWGSVIFSVQGDLTVDLCAHDKWTAERAA